METRVLFPKRLDSKTIALLAIFLAMVFALEIYPLTGLTDIPIPGIYFTIDWTGIPLVLIFLFFGPVASLLGVGFMGLIIGYRNPFGAVFKVLAEFYKILGILSIWIFIRKREISYSKRVALYTVFAALFCTVGMFITNIPLLQVLYGYTPEAALATSTVMIPWNAIQSVINVFGGTFLFRVIPDDLKLTFLYDETQQQDNLILENED